MTTRPIGIVGVAFADIALDEMATRAADLGFDHLDAAIHLVEPLDDDALAALAVPIVDRISGFELVDGCTFVAPYERRGEDRFDETVALIRAHPTARLEPGPHTSAGSIEKIEALAAAVPGLQLTLDTGHVAWWGEDRCRRCGTPATSSCARRPRVVRSSIPTRAATSTSPPCSPSSTGSTTAAR